MIDFPNMIMVGALKRNVGKTELACSLIEYFSQLYEVIGIKVTTIRPLDRTFHLDVPDQKAFLQKTKKVSLVEEVLNKKESKTDTQRMLSHGAKRAFWLCVGIDYLQEGAQMIKDVAFESGLDKPLIICETNSLRQVVKPGYFVLVGEDSVFTSEEIKPSVVEIRSYADRLIQYESRMIQDLIKKIKKTLNP